MNNTPDKPGYYRSFHHTEYMEALKALFLAGDDAHAKALLEPLLDSIEAEDRVEQIGVDLWHYTQLVNIYMREGNDAAANAVLERYARHDHFATSLVLHSPSQ